jgi:hypothetical protein
LLGTFASLAADCSKRATNWFKRVSVWTAFMTSFPFEFDPADAGSNSMQMLCQGEITALAGNF